MNLLSLSVFLKQAQAVPEPSPLLLALLGGCALLNRKAKL